MTSEQPRLLRQDDVPTSPAGQSPLEDTMINGMHPPDLRKSSPSSGTAPSDDPGRTARLAPPDTTSLDHPGPAPSRGTHGPAAAPRPRRMPPSSGPVPGSSSGGWQPPAQRTPVVRLLMVLAGCLGAVLVGVVVAYAVRAVVGSSSVAPGQGAGAPLDAATPAASAPQSPAPSGVLPSEAVPAGEADGWVPAAAAPEGLGFSHPPGWTLRQDQTGIFYTDPASEGLQEVGVKRDAASQDTAEAARQYTAGNLAPLAGAKTGQVTTAADGSAAVQVRYTRNGIAARFLVRAVTHGTGVAILVVRAPDDGSPTAEHLMTGLSGTLANP